MKNNIEFTGKNRIIYEKLISILSKNKKILSFIYIRNCNTMCLNNIYHGESNCVLTCKMYIRVNFFRELVDRKIIEHETLRKSEII